MNDPLEIRYARMTRERERCLQTLRSHYGHLPRPVVAAVQQLAEFLMHLDQMPDDELETTQVGRR
jgi:hypothetical protein